MRVARWLRARTKWFHAVPVVTLGVLSSCVQTSPSSELSATARTERKLDALIEQREEVGFQYSAVRETETLLEYAGGVIDAAGSARVTPQTQFLSASSTKVLTATAVLKLMEEGALQLSDPVSKYVPYQPYGERVTITHLLDHSSGVPNPLPLTWVHTHAEHPGYDEAAALRLELTRHPKLDFEPGTQYAYSNLSYWLLGRVIEAASHMDYATFIRRELLDPLGISEQDMSTEITLPTWQARGHLARWSLLGIVVPLMAESKIMSAPQGKWLRFEHLYMNGPAYGGMRATARGYARFLQDLLQPRSRILSAETKRLLFTAQEDKRGRPLPTTLGFHTGDLDGIPYISKPGGGPGFSSNLRIYPTQHLATCFLSNQMRASESSIQRLSDHLDRELLATRKH